mgnify:CR=1 FL=1
MTEKIRNERLGKYGNGLEEMRAEVLAMYTAIRFYDDIVKSNFMGDWPQKVSSHLFSLLSLSLFLSLSRTLTLSSLLVPLIKNSFLSIRRS